MRTKLLSFVLAGCIAATFGFSLSLYAADKNKTEKPKAAPAEADPYTEMQPETEKFDLAMYRWIQDKGMNHSYEREFVSAQADGIGTR